MKHSTIAVAVSFALMGSTAYAQGAQQSQVAPQTETAPSAGQQAAPQAGQTGQSDQQSNLNSDDQSFLENAIQGSYAEIEGSQLALEKTQDPAVKDFAQMMIKDHKKMLEEAQTLAKDKGLSPPTGPSAMQRTEITGLKALSGGAFDAMYVNRIGVASHEATVEMFETASREAKDPDVKAMAQKTLPKLQAHLKEARALDEKQEDSK